VKAKGEVTVGIAGQDGIFLDAEAAPILWLSLPGLLFSRHEAPQRSRER
jgi:hypothetical protein